MNPRLRLLALIEATTLTGPARNLRQFAAQAADSVQLEVATFLRGQASNSFIETLRADGIPVHVIPERSAFDHRVIDALVDLAERLDPDVVQTHAVKSHFLARCAGWPRRWPWVAFHHGYTWPTFKARLFNQLDRWSLPAARRVITVSRPFRQELIAQGVEPERITVVHNAIDLGEWTAPDDGVRLRQEFGIGATEPVAVIIGRLSAEKNHELMFEALRILHDQGVPLRLVCVGEGPARPLLESRLRAEGWQGTAVILAGQREEIRPFYAMADVAVLPSRSEGSPNALLEAMAMRVPVVATAVGGVPEIATSGENALLVPSGNAQALSQAIATLLASREEARRMADLAYAHVREHFTPAARVERLLEIYSSLFRPGTARGSVE